MNKKDVSPLSGDVSSTNLVLKQRRRDNSAMACAQLILTSSVYLSYVGVWTVTVGTHGVERCPHIPGTMVKMILLKNLMILIAKGHVYLLFKRLYMKQYMILRTFSVYFICFKSQSPGIPLDYDSVLFFVACSSISKIRKGGIS